MLTNETETGILSLASTTTIQASRDMPTLDVQALRSAMKSQSVTISRLASISRVSRAQLSRLLPKRAAPARQATISRLAKALDVSPVALTVGGELNRYREYVVREHEKLDFRGIGMPQLERQPIEDIFGQRQRHESPRPAELGRTSSFHREFL